MKLSVYRAMWGFAHPLETALPALHAKGYAGIEISLDDPRLHRPDFVPRLRAEGFGLALGLHTQGTTVDEHLRFYRDRLARARPRQADILSCHTGEDRWTPAESRRFFSEALRIEADEGVRVAHETHRGRVFYNPWTTFALLEEFPTLGLCCDFSHWVCVCERLLENEADILALAARHCVHVHARVGYPQGPQVTDPRVSDWTDALHAHESWWDQVWHNHALQGRATTTLTPEFGPPPYQHTDPRTGRPLSDLDEICDWMTRRQQTRFNGRLVSPKAG